MIVTASLSTGIARTTRGLQESIDLMDHILAIEHKNWETILCIGDVEFRTSKGGGPYPNHQMRVSVKPSSGYAAINYMDHDDAEMVVANSYNPDRPLPDVSLVFNGESGAVFPRTASILIGDARKALMEWLNTRRRPTSIAWRPFDIY